MDEWIAGPDPIAVDQAISTRATDNIVSVEYVPADDSRKVRRDDLDVVVAEDHDVASALVHAPVITLGKKPRVVDANDLEGRVA